MGEMFLLQCYCFWGRCGNSWLFQRDGFLIGDCPADKSSVRTPTGVELNYIHYNPVTGKWNIATDFVSYEHSSASFYEERIIKHFEPKHYKSL
jgi:hypothetical protein